MLKVKEIPDQGRKLGRQLVHDSRSRAFAIVLPVDRSTWRDRSIRIYDPLPNPNQRVGCCTAVAKSSQLNAQGNRRVGRVLNLSDAERMYRRNTELDPFEGTWEPDDTGSSGLASCKTAQEFGLGGAYFWELRGADGVVQNVMQGRVMSVGTWWYDGMFDQDAQGRVRKTGSRAGGHQYIIRGYDADNDWVLGRCWWGRFRDFWMTRAELDELLMDDGDAHFQYTV